MRKKKQQKEKKAVSPQKQIPIKRDIHKPLNISPSPLLNLHPPSLPNLLGLLILTSKKPQKENISYKQDPFLPPLPKQDQRTVTVECICNVDGLAVQSELAHQQMKVLGPLLKLKLLGGKDVENLENFPDVPMVTTFI